MTPNERLAVIDEKIKRINNEVLATKKWKIAFANKGANNYCLTIVLDKKEIFSGKFATFDSVLSSLLLLEFMFSKALNERNGGK